MCLATKLIRVRPNEAEVKIGERILLTCDFQSVDNNKGLSFKFNGGELPSNSIMSHLRDTIIVVINEVLSNNFGKYTCERKFAKLRFKYYDVLFLQEAKSDKERYLFTQLTTHTSQLLGKCSNTYWYIL